MLSASGPHEIKEMRRHRTVNSGKHCVTQQPPSHLYPPFTKGRQCRVAALAPSYQRREGRIWSSRILSGITVWHRFSTAFVSQDTILSGAVHKKQADAASCQEPVSEPRFCFQSCRLRPGTSTSARPLGSSWSEALSFFGAASAEGQGNRPYRGTLPGKHCVSQRPPRMPSRVP
jgi:hypothetical protein